MKLLPPPPSYPLLAEPKNAHWGASPLVPLLRYVMVIDRLTRIRQSVDEHTPDACPFVSHAYGAFMHGDDCRWAMLVHERWHREEIERRDQAVTKLGDQLAELQLAELQRARE